MSDDTNIPNMPEGIEVPDSPEGLVNPRFYRKQAQHALMHALHESAGRSGLTDNQKVEQLMKMQAFLTEAHSAVTLALELMETGEVKE